MNNATQTDTETMAKHAELLALREELARLQNLNRINDLRKAVIMNERALPHLGGIPARHARLRIAAAREELTWREYLAQLEADAA